MPNSSNYITSLLQTTGPKIANQAIMAFQLQPVHISPLHTILQQDGAGSFVKACISIVDAFAGLSRGLASWAIIKFYYSVFYCARTQLQLAGECHVYFNLTPYSLECRSGAAFMKGAGTSHEYAFTQFTGRFPSLTPLTQKIDNEPPLKWLKGLREELQYRATSFEDFDFEKVLPKFDVTRAARFVREYVGRDAPLYAFDPDHAAIAFPMFFFAETTKQLRLGSRKLLTSDQFAFIQRRCQVGAEHVGAVVELIRQVSH